VLVLAHTGGAAALDLPPWGLAYGAAAVVLVVTAAWRARFVVDAARNGGEPAADTSAGHDDSGTGARRRPGRTALAITGRALGLGGLGLVVAAALLGPTASAANLAPSAVLVVWWVGLPLACAVGGDVMGWLDPFGTLGRAAARVLGRGTRAPAAASPTLLAGTAAASLAAFTWWSLAYHDGRSPGALGWFLAGYTVLATAAAAWGPQWPRRGEGFGALSWGLAAARRRDPGARRPPTLVVAAVVAVWLGGLAFDLFSGTRAWVDLASSTSGWARTGRATACLAVAVAAAGLVVGATLRWARGGAGTADRGATTAPAPGGRRTTDDEADDRADPDRDDPRRRVGSAVALAWLATTAGAVVAHGLTLLLVDGQFALALVSDPFGRGWDLLGTADRAIDYSPWTPGAVGTAQIVLVTVGAVWGVSAAGRTLSAARRQGLDARAALRALWVAGLIGAVTAAAVVAALASDLE
jgi:hypothetical protein